jgi:archaellum component FlaG (FlaF/FlaG flagellin family)
MVFADSRLIKQDAKQTANCDTVGADSPVSNSCNQSAANNVNNGVPRTTGTPETTGTLLIKFVCNIPECATGLPSIVVISGNNPQPDTLTFTVSGSQLVTLDPGTFRVLVISAIGTGLSGDCGLDNNPIRTGQHLTCTVIAAP